MTSIDFISQLNKKGLSQKEIESFGLPDAEEIAKGFYPSKTGKISISNHLIVRLIEEYTMSDTYFISVIKFRDDIEELDNKIYVGWIWEDPIVIDRITGAVDSLTFWDPESISFQIAKDSECFLKAFLVGGILEFEIPSEENYSRIKKQREINAELAAELAGGIEYAPFWRAIYHMEDDNPILDHTSFLN